MRDYPLQIYISSDKKSIIIQPVVGRISDGIGISGYFSGKFRYSCSDEELGKSIFNGFDYIIGKYENVEDIDKPGEKVKGIPWTKRGMLCILKYKDGPYKLFLEYVNHEVMTTSTATTRELPANISAEEMGREVKSAFDFVFDYALRQEIYVYHSEKEGLFFVPCAVGKTGYVLADFCVRVEEPYSPKEIRAAAEKVFAYAAENPKDKRTSKERKQNLPWREFSKYKSFHGFVKSNHCVEMHRLTDGSYVFIPTLRMFTYGSEFVEYVEIQTVKSGGISDEEFKDEIFAALDRSRLITEKCEEYRDMRIDPKNERFFEYVSSIAAQLEKQQF
ncbi:MAG: hypothetical protein K2K57_01495 [Oscillospiraceae bacterium]|nr:hypothetical protein [Oscillospiraceae bacterium]